MPACARPTGVWRAGTCAFGRAGVRRVSHTRFVRLIFFSSAGWETWGFDRRPLIPERMPVLVDEDLRFFDESGPRPSAVVNRWLCDRPTNGAPTPASWAVYARAMRAWLEFLQERGVRLFDDRERLRAALAMYAEHRFAGPLEARLAPATWNLQIGVVAAFYRWRSPRTSPRRSRLATPPRHDMARLVGTRRSGTSRRSGHRDGM